MRVIKIYVISGVLLFIGLILVAAIFLVMQNFRPDELSYSATPSPTVSPDTTPSPTPVPTTTLLVTGDVMLGRYVNARTLRENDMLWPWRNITTIFRSADIVFANLESPLTDPCPVTQTGMIFCGDIRHAAAMKQAGVTVAGIANNHGEDQGVSGFHQTNDVLRSAGILPIGTDEPAIVRSNGITFAFLAYNDAGPSYQQVVPQAHKNVISLDIQSARVQADVVIVMYHWGNEYTHTPTQRQRELAHFTVDAGANLVVGNHPHWIQPIEWYNDTPIMYSHGNLIFDQNWSRKTSEGVIGTYTFHGKDIVDVDMTSVIIEQNSQPRPATEREHENIIRDVITE